MASVKDTKVYMGQSPCPPVTFQLVTKLKNLNTERGPSKPHLVQPLCFMDRETEVLRGDRTWPRQHSLTVEKSGRDPKGNIPDKKSVSMNDCVCV